MIKSIVTNFRAARQAIPGDPELDALLDALYKKLASKQEQLQQAARAAVVPVKHKLSIVPTP